MNWPNGSLQLFVPDTIYRRNVLGCHPHYTPIEKNQKKRSFNEFYYDLVIETIGPVRKSGNHPPSAAQFLRHFIVVTFERLKPPSLSSMQTPNTFVAEVNCTLLLPRGIGFNGCCLAAGEK